MSDDDERRESLLQEVKTLRQEVARAPGDVDLRLRLISLQLSADQPQSAWHNSLHILKDDPDHVEALRLAKQAAESVGHGRAREYAARLHQLTSAPPGKRRGVALRLIRGGRDASA